MSAKIELLPIKRSRVFQGHPWVFANEIKSAPDAKLAGQSVELYDARNHFLGSGIYNPNSKIIWRRFSSEKCTFDANFLETALTAAVQLRGHDTTCRLVWSECDNIPGLVVDRFNDVLSLQALTFAVDRNLDTIISILQKLIHPREIVFAQRRQCTSTRRPHSRNPHSQRQTA
jgi:23S rRNA (cytosine1962-C5)-methyltransferase